MTPALLMMPEYAGTLAAARCLARHGIPVHIAAQDLLAPAAWSRSVSKRLRGPNFLKGPGPVLEWLLDRASQQSGMVLYPTCDELAWLLARHRDVLEPHYRLYSPDFSAIRSILDKRDLYRSCSAVGIDVPETWCPETATELEEVVRGEPACLVKPRMQTFFNAHVKGDLARGESELKRVWQSYRAAEFPPEIVADIPDIGLPLVQRYVPVASSGVFSVSGFIDKSGAILATRGSRKVLQDPPNAGIGVCFDSVEPPSGLAELISALCKRLGYFGVFEVEFLQAGPRYLLIDFNPRYFGQMEFDIARGMELPWLAQLCALGDEQAAMAAAAAADSNGASNLLYYHNKVALNWRLATGSVLGAMSSEERLRWREWVKEGAGQSVDAYLAPGDVYPAVAHAASTLWDALRHPRGFWRSIQTPKTA